MTAAKPIPTLALPFPHPRPFSRKEKGGSSFLSPSGREVRSEGWKGRESS